MTSAAVGLAGTRGGPATARTASPDLKLRYRQPAKSWVETVPIECFGIVECLCRPFIVMKGVAPRGPPYLAAAKKDETDRHG